MSKSNNVINKGDVWTMIQKAMDKKTFDTAFEQLNEDGQIYPVYGDEIFSINE